jgi:hypothetical protein
MLMKLYNHLCFLLFGMLNLGLSAQCPGPGPCPAGNFDPSYEQIDPSSIAGAVFCSGQTRTFTIGVGPGTLTEAATGDIEFITLFFDFDCDGVFEYSVNDSCNYVNPGGCSVDLSVTAPTVLASTTFNARAHLVFNTPTTDPCAALPGTWGDIVDFTITVGLPPEPILTSTDLDNTICQGDSVTFTATDGDEYEFYVNGTSIQGQSASNTYITSSLDNGDIVTVRAINNLNGCDTFSAGITMSVLDPIINTQPVLTQSVFSGVDTVFSVGTTDVDTYQWQVSTNAGMSFSDISDGISYSGTTSASLTIISPDIDKNSYIFRVIASNALAGCMPLNSDGGTLLVRPRTIITNRRITYRVTKS